MSHSTVNPDGEELMQCPYDPHHMIAQMRFPYHLIRCRKNHGGGDHQQCPYDAKHVILKSEFEDHIKTCDKKAIIEPQLVLDNQRGDNLQVPDSNAHQIEQTLSSEWDIEAPTAVQSANNRQVVQTTHSTFLGCSTRTEDGRLHQWVSGNVSCRGRSNSSDGAHFLTGGGPGSSSNQTRNSYPDDSGPVPFQSKFVQSGRGRGLLNFVPEGALRRPAKSSQKGGVGGASRESLEKQRQILHKKIFDIQSLKDRHQNGEVLEQGQISKIGQLDRVQSELNQICKQLERL